MKVLEQRCIAMFSSGGIKPPLFGGLFLFLGLFVIAIKAIFQALFHGGVYSRHNIRRFVFGHVFQRATIAPHA